VLPDGEVGELVFTSLTKEAMPVIRYRTRDLTRLLPGTARSMRRMEKITGRSDDMLIIRGVNVFPTQVEEQIFGCAGLSAHYQIEVTREGRLDAMRVWSRRATTSPTRPRGAQAELLCRHIKDLIGVSATVSVLDPGTLERSLGKAKRVVDKRPRD
jgi:phenylacetate-CoA ligase